MLEQTSGSKGSYIIYASCIIQYIYIYNNTYVHIYNYIAIYICIYTLVTTKGAIPLLKKRATGNGPTAFQSGWNGPTAFRPDVNPRAATGQENRNGPT